MFPTWRTRAKHLAQALWRWVRLGFVGRDAQTVARIYHEVCGTCALRQPTENPEVSWCGACGCRLSSRRNTLNKIALGTEHCDLGLW